MSSRELRTRVGGAHQRRADEHGIRAGELGGGRLRARLDRRSRRSRRDRAARVRRARAARARSIANVAEVARVDADHRRVERDGARELVRVVRLDERVEPERVGAAPCSSRGGASSRSRRSSSAASAPASRASRRCSGVEKKPLASSGSVASPRAPRAGRPTSRRSARRRAPTSRVRRPLRSARATCGDVAVRAKVARRRRAPLELRDRAEPRRRERVLEPHDADSLRERDELVEARRRGAGVERLARERQALRARSCGVAARGDRARGVQQDRRARAAVAAVRTPRGSARRSPSASPPRSSAGSQRGDAEVERVDLALRARRRRRPRRRGSGRRARARRCRRRRARRTRGARRAARARRRSPARACGE